ncbi:MAG TPA: hypothetical protein VLM18_11770 [Croceibacterium sp.]|nr:hypothetical protein [Croceibacterium sp.]
MDDPEDFEVIRRNLARDDRGATIIEFALVAPNATLVFDRKN